MNLTRNTKLKGNYTPLLPEVVYAPYPHPLRQNKSPQEAVDHALEEVQNILENPYGGLANPAGIFVEPIQAKGGIITLPEGFLQGLRDIADDNDIPLMFDEIQSGFGRTDKW